MILWTLLQYEHMNYMLQYVTMMFSVAFLARERTRKKMAGWYRDEISYISIWICPYVIESSELHLSATREWGQHLFLYALTSNHFLSCWQTDSGSQWYFGFTWASLPGWFSCVCIEREPECMCRRLSLCQRKEHMRSEHLTYLEWL